MDLQKLYRYVRQVCEKYALIEDGDRIAVAVSGGKDSLALLYALAGLRRFYPASFDICAVIIDLGFGMDYEAVESLCRQLDVPCHICRTQIREIVFQDSSQRRHCSFCANLRRGALVQEAMRLGCSKLALGHHRDDVIHTMLMSMIFEGRFYAFSPYTEYPDHRLAVIRPLVYVRECDIKSFAGRYSLPVVQNLCPEDGNSARGDMKELMRQLSARYPDAGKHFFHAIENGNIDDWLAAGAGKHEKRQSENGEYYAEQVLS